VYKRLPFLAKFLTNFAQQYPYMPAPWPLVYRRTLLIALAIIGHTLVTAGSLAAQEVPSEKKDSVKTSLPTPDKGGLDKQIDYKASDSIVFDIKRNMVYLYRDAVLVYGSINLQAYYIAVDLKKKEIFATGGLDSNGHYAFLPVLKDGDDSYTADSMRYNSGSKKGRVYGLRLKEDEAYIHLSKVLKQEDGSFVGEKGKITTCEEDHPHFYFNTQKIKVIPNNKVLFGPAYLVVEDVPTPLAVPFGLAPIKKGRQNGILFPSPGYNANNQTFFLQNLGYYTGLGPYADLTLNADAYFNGDLRLGASTNFVKRYKYRGNLAVSMSWFGNGAEITSPTFSRDVDFKIMSRFDFDPKFLPGTSLSGNINIQTGNFNKLNASNLNSFAQNQFNSGINYGRNFFQNRLNLSASARHSQNTADRSFRLELPSLSLGIPSITPFGKMDKDVKVLKQLRLSYNMQFNNVLNTYDTLLFSSRGRDEFKNLQNGIRHSLPITTNFKALKGILNFNPSFNYTELWYFKSTLQSLDTGRTIKYRDSMGFNRLSTWSVSTSMTTNIYGTFTNMKTGKLRAMRHTMSPAISVGYTPEISPARLGHTRTYYDTAAKDSTVTYNIFERGIYGPVSQSENANLGFRLGNNLQAKKVVSVDSTGKETQEKVNLIDALSISANYNFLADSFNWSDLRLDMNTTLLKIVRIHVDGAYSFYGVDANKNRVNAYAWKYNKKPLHFQNFNIQMNTSLTPETFKKKGADKKHEVAKEDEGEFGDVQRNPGNYIDFNIPWSLNLTYYFDYNNNGLTRMDKINAHRVGFGGDVRITPQWKVGFESGYDLARKELAGSQFSVARNLHCWELEFKWIPDGAYKRWMFTLRPKSGLLQDLKLNKKVSNNPAYYLGN
jgi:hypothetical protein